MPAVGTPGRLLLFFWSLALVLLAPERWFALAAGLALLANGLLFARAFKRLLRWRWLLFIVLLFLPSLFWAYSPDQSYLGISYSQQGLVLGIQMIVRAIVTLVAVDVFASGVDISEVAGLFERAGLTGLGFSMGVAVNLLPSIRHSGRCAWQSLRMRGGFRRRWLRGGKLLLITVATNAIRRAEEIALAAETRAFTPERARPLPIRRGTYDWFVVVGVIGSVLFLILTT